MDVPCVARYRLRVQSHGPNFRCPICRSTVYRSVIVRKIGGQYYQTEFFECGGCTTMFRDPIRFTAHVPPPDNLIEPPDLRTAWRRRTE